MNRWLYGVAVSILLLPSCEKARTPAPRAEAVPEEEPVATVPAVGMKPADRVEEALAPAAQASPDGTPEGPVGAPPPAGDPEPTVGDRVDRALEATGHGVKVAGEKTAEGVGTAAEKTGEALKTAGEKTEEGVKKAAGATGRFLRKVGEKIEEKAGGEGETGAPEAR